MAQASDHNVIILQHSETDFAGLITRANSETELGAVCARLGNMLGLPMFSIMQSPIEMNSALSDMMLLSNWSPALISEYDRNNLLENSSLFLHLKSSTEPYFVDDDYQNLNDEDFLAASIFQIYGIREGIFFSAHLADGQVGYVSFCGEANVLRDDQIKELNYFSGLIFSRLHSLRSTTKNTEFNLGQREVDCLYWISRGKTSTEISTILGVSETAIEHYIASVVRKLDANNQAHAASKAIRLKIIE